MWFNNVETKPGVGYPKRWEDQEHYKGGWVLNKKGKLELKSGSRWTKMALGKIFTTQICLLLKIIMNHGHTITNI